MTQNQKNNPTKKQINTIYIISKGRPQCKTAQTLTKMDYPGQWFIVCGTNDETIPEYIKIWGKDRILIFDWHEEIKTTDTLDNFGFVGMPSGATPVRNATRRISEERGELRHWQFDDDYRQFVKFSPKKFGYKAATPEDLEEALYQIALFGFKSDLPNAGFAIRSETFPNNALTTSKRVFNAHNMPTDPAKFQFWRGWMNDDLINALEVYQKGRREYSFKFLGLEMLPTQSEKGGLTDIYQEIGTVRKTSYAILIAPNAVRLVIKFGRYHHHVYWDRVSPKLINEKYAKV
jgi:hypothetical protein